MRFRLSPPWPCSPHTAHSFFVHMYLYIWTVVQTLEVGQPENGLLSGLSLLARPGHCPRHTLFTTYNYLSPFLPFHYTVPAGRPGEETADRCRSKMDLRCRGAWEIAFPAEGRVWVPLLYCRFLFFRYLLSFFSPSTKKPRQGIDQNP